MAGYYGPGGRAGTAERPNLGREGEREGDLAMKIWNMTPSGRDLDADSLRKRPDVGRVETWEAD